MGGGDVVLVNGESVQRPDLSADRLLGLTCFDTIAFQAGKLLVGEAHLERLASGARTLALTPVGGWEAIDDAIETALELSDHEEGIVRVSLHARGEPTGLHFAERSADVQTYVTAPRYGDVSEGVTVVTSTMQAPGPSWPAHVKAPNLVRILAHREARGRGAFEGLMLDARDDVVSGTRSNVFARLGDKLITPTAPPAFPGTRRRAVLEATGGLGLQAQARPLAREDLDRAEEIFLTFTGPDVVPVVELDGEPVHHGEAGPWTREIAQAVP